MPLYHLHFLRIALVLAVATLFIVPACRHGARLEIYEENEAYQVYSSILPKTNALVLRGGTATYDLCLVPLDEQAEHVLHPALVDFEKINSKRWILRDKFEATQPTILPEQELESTFPEGTSGDRSRQGWKAFVQRHPNYPGWIELSAVGFNSDRTIAIVYMGYHCGEQCEGGEFKALEKKNGRWQLLTGRGRWNHCVWMHTDTRASSHSSPPTPFSAYQTSHFLRRMP